ncbi:MAG: hypothetical protein PHW93_07365 [Candidatus Methanomethylophilaceae archaeon]|nr:hypothetical protein [Candidatus Methanomethylophilaceae archaeon]
METRRREANKTGELTEMATEKEITVSIIAAKGQGKSVFLASELNKLKKGILIDTIGVFDPRSRFKTAVVPNSSYFESPAAYIKTDKKPKKSVIDFSGFIGSELVEKMDVLAAYIYQNIPNMPVLIDEVADIMPLQGGSKELHRLIKNGRNHGNKPFVFATQRPQNMNKNIFDLCDVFFVSMQRAPRTVEYIADLADLRGDKEFVKKIKSLKQREFLRYDGVKIDSYRVPIYKYAFKQ